MRVWAFLSWWYGQGWLGESKLQSRRLARVESYFGFRTLLTTLFQPFRQIDAGQRRGGLGVQMRAWLDRTISRVIGAGARLVLLVIGSLWWLVSALMSAGWLLIWPLLPVAPLLGFAGMLMGVGSL